MNLARSSLLEALARVVQKVDNVIHRINRYPADKCLKTNHAIRWIVIYPVDSIIQSLNNWGQEAQLRVGGLIASENLKEKYKKPWCFQIT